MSSILVIEDEPDQNKLIKLRLEARGFKVISVGKAKDGIEAARKEQPVLILMDMILPDMHGLDASIKLKQMAETRSIPIIALSAVGSPDFIKACLQEGITAYIKKPYDPRELFKIIERNVRIEEVTEKPKPKAADLKNYKQELEEMASEIKNTPTPPLPQTKPSRKEIEQKKRIEEMLEQALEDFGFSHVSKGADSSTRQKKKEGAKPPMVLLIDDDTALVKAISAELVKKNYQVSFALDAVNGIKSVFERHPDVILVNLILPGGGGEEVISNLKKYPETQKIPIIILSGFLPPHKLADKASELEVQGFLSKPVELTELYYLIESVLQD